MFLPASFPPSQEITTQTSTLTIPNLRNEDREEVCRIFYFAELTSEYHVILAQCTSCVRLTSFHCGGRCLMIIHRLEKFVTFSQVCTNFRVT